MKKVVAAAALAAAALAVASCGSSSRLAWEGTPKLYIPADLPGDRILSATVRNTGNRDLVVKVPDLRVVDGQGRRIGASAQFVRTYGHGLIYPDTQTRDKQPLVEQRRIGYQIRLAPGKTAPLIVSWHQPRSGGAPTALDYGQGKLSLPADRTATRARG